MEVYEIKRTYKQDGSERDAALAGYRQILAEHPGGVPEDTGAKLVVLAADYAHPEALALLFDAGVSAAIDTGMEFTLLHVLARGSDSHYCQKPRGAVAACVNLLLDQRVSALRKDLDGRTCYHYAAERGMYELIEVLAARGTKLTLTDSRGNTGIHIAAEEAGRAVYDIARAAKKIDRAMAQYQKIYGQQKGYGKSGAEIADYMTKFMNGLTPNADQERAELAQAERLLEDYFHTVRAFAEGGVDPSEKNSYGECTALDYAVKSDAKKIAAYLSGTLVEGDERSIAAGGMTLHQAAEKGDVAAIHALIGAGADPNACKDGDAHPFGGCTALAIACAHLQFDAVDALLANGADPSRKDGGGKTAAGYLVTDLKASASAKVFDENRITRILHRMASAGMDINETVNDDGDTLLISACKSAPGTGYNNRSIKGDIIHAALALRPDLCLKSRFGETALMHACAHDFDRMEQVQLILLEQGADVAAADQNGDTALHYAARNRDKNGARTLCDMLLDFGADAAAVNNAGRTALDIAVETGNEPLVKLLLGKL